LAGRALAGAAGPLVIALWAAVPLAASLAGSADAATDGRSILSGGGLPLAPRAAVWASAAAVLRYALGAARRGLWMSVWLTGLLIGQTMLPALAGAAPGAPGRPGGGPWGG